MWLFQGLEAAGSGPELTAMGFLVLRPWDWAASTAWVCLSLSASVIVGANPV